MYLCFFGAIWLFSRVDLAFFAYDYLATVARTQRFASCAWPMVLRKLGIGENEKMKADSTTETCFS